MREFEDNSRARDRLKKLMKGLVIGDSKPRYYNFRVELISTSILVLVIFPTFKFIRIVDVCLK